MEVIKLLRIYRVNICHEMAVLVMRQFSTLIYVDNLILSNGSFEILAIICMVFQHNFKLTGFELG